jgi:hypothetical protein
MKGEAYPAARAVAPKLQAYFTRHREAAVRSGGTHLAPLPDTETIEAIIDAAFWASLRREEGYEPRISLAFLPPEQALHPLILARPLGLDPDALTRVAPAVESPGIHLGVWRDGEELSVWGTTRTIPLLCFVLEVAAPGLLVIKNHSGDESRKFINVAVLEGDQVKVVDERDCGSPHCPHILNSLMGLDGAAAEDLAVDTMVRLAVAMREHGRGGSLLVVPADTDAWRESIVQPMRYAVSPPFRELANHEAATIASTIAAVGGLTAVDGAVVLTNRHELLGFGAKIGRRQRWPRVEQVTLTEPIEGSTPALVHPEQLGGTRHFSAAQFVHDQRDAIAFVASQDGRFTVFEWSPGEGMVHAHRIETLLF